MTTDNLFRYFSQNGEDFLLWEFFDHKEDGFFVDVGAFDGVHLSNSYFFEQVGWKGICVEPHARFFALCEKNRPGTACINCLAGSKDGVEIPFYQEKLGLLSTTVVDADVEADVTKRYESRGLVFEGFSEVVLKTQTLNTMLHNHLEPGEKIDFISIDVEGAELEVLRGLSLEEFAPRVLVIEANSAAHVKELTEYLEPFGYFLARKHEVNFYFVSSQEDAHKLQEIIVDCQIEKQSHPDGLELTLPEFITGKNIIQNLPKQKYINKTQDSIAEHMALVKTRNDEISRQKIRMQELNDLLDKSNGQLAEHIKLAGQKNELLSKRDEQIDAHKARMLELNDLLDKSSGKLAEHIDLVKSRNAEITTQNAEIAALKRRLAEKVNLLEDLSSSFRSLTALSWYKSPLLKLKKFRRLLIQLAELGKK